MNNTLNTVDTRPLMVSIRCITYNHEPYIRQCLDGFVMQKTNFRFEAIVHDDASTDGTAAIIREYAEKYPDIIKPIFETENQYSKHDGSLGRIMDEACTGKYIAMCEGDDYWIDPQKLQLQVDFMESHPDFTLCGTNGLLIWDLGENSPSYFNDIFESRELLASDIIGKWAMPTASLLYRREVKNDYPEWSKKIYSGDQTLLMVSLYRGRLFCFGNLTCVYRKSSSNETSISNRVGWEYHLNQHVQLYSYYDEWTNYKYHDLVENYIVYLRSEIDREAKMKRYALLYERNRLLPLLKMPRYVLKQRIDNLDSFFCFNRSKIFEINNYRKVLFGISILFIIIYHIWSDTQSNGLSSFRMGYIGVDIFFFLSALGCSYAYNKYSLRRFYLRRFLRILPINSVFVVICGLLAALVWGKGWTLSSWLLKLTTLNFFNPHLSGPNWYISSLLILYALFPFLFFLVKRFSRFVVYSAFLLSFITLYNFPEITWYHSSFISRIGVFLFGILCYMLTTKDKRITSLEVFFMAIAAIVLSSRYCYMPFLATALFAPVFIAICIYIIRHFSQKSLFIKLLSWLGTYSLELFLGNCLIRTISFHFDYTQFSTKYLFLFYLIGTCGFGMCLALVNKQMSSWLYKQVLNKDNDEA